MRKLALLTAVLFFMTSPAVLWAFEPDTSNEMQLDAARAILDVKNNDPGIQEFFDGAAAYAVFPSVGKGAIGVGGAHGKGLVIVDDKVIGKTSLSQITIGLSLGGQKYAQFIFFKDDVALGHFKRGNYEMGAQASAVAVTAGASADADYDGGVAVFTNIAGGLMADASVGGQKFTFEAQ
jgi:hypothetical protein